MPRSSTALLLLAATAVLVAALPAEAGRRRAFRTVRVDLPVDGALADDAALLAAARVGTNFAPLSVAVRLDGVDLIAALGLVPPFFGAGGVVAVGPDAVGIADFDFDTSAGGKMVLSLSAAGLSPGVHTLEVQAERVSDAVLVSDTASFRRVAAFGEALRTLGAAGLPDGATPVGASGTLGNAVLGQPLAAPPVPLSGGGALRSGFVPGAEGRILGGTP